MPQIISNGIKYTGGDPFSGKYEDLEGKPTVFGPSGPNAKEGFVPSPGTTAGTEKYLREDGTWAIPPDTDTWKANTKDSDGYVAKGNGHANQVWKTDENGVPGWRADANTTYGNMTAATASAAGKAGLVPAPPAGAQGKYLTGAGTWQNADDHVTAFTSADVDDGVANAWTSVAKLTSGEKHSSIFNKLSTMFKNVRYLYKMLGTTDISAIGNGTVTGAISALNTGMLKCIETQATSMENGWIEIPKEALGINPQRIVSVVGNSYVIPYSIRTNSLVAMILSIIDGNIVVVPNSTTYLRIYYI